MMKPGNITSKPKVYTLNALRGYSAIFVAFYHMIENGQYVDPDYWPEWYKYFYANCSLRILIFFIISGAVIQLSNKIPLSVNTIPTYVKKRITRLYPLYVVGLITAILVSTVPYSWRTIAGNFAFLQVLFCKVILANGPVWTLHYEVLFYILFIPVSMYNINPVKIFTASLGLGLINYLLYPSAFAYPLISAYCIGFSFWMLGLIIVKYFPVDAVQPVNYTKMVSFLFLITAVPYLNGIHILIY
jgi:peptidoglycan/LPS O-acetylase OafA/YrhL